MDVISVRFSSALNPDAPPYVPSAYRAVEDFSDEWWALVDSSPSFRDYWLRESFQEPETDPDLSDIYDPAIDNPVSPLNSHASPRRGEEEKGVKSKMEVAKLVAALAEKWRGPFGEMVGPRYSEKAPKVVSAKVRPRMIQQPR